MTITQTVEIPASHRLVIDVPHEVPAGKAIIAFTPAGKRKMTEAEETEYINRNAEWLNNEADDVLEYQNLDAIEKDLELSRELVAMRDAIVPFNLADIVFDRDDKRFNPASLEERPI
jgi:hypothetical protein